MIHRFNRNVSAYGKVTNRSLLLIFVSPSLIPRRISEYSSFEIKVFKDFIVTLLALTSTGIKESASRIKKSSSALLSDFDRSKC